MDKFVCRRFSDCMYKDVEGRCMREATYVALDEGGHYGNEDVQTTKYPYLVNITACEFQGRKLKLDEKLPKGKGRRRFL